MESLELYNESELRDIYRKFEGPKTYYIYVYNEETKKYDFLKLSQASTAAWKPGYKIVDYYNILSKKMVPTVAKLFEDVCEKIEEIGNTKIISKDNKTISEYFTGSYKAIENFFIENTVPNQSTDLLSQNCLKTISLDDQALLNNYNTYQRKLNEAAKANYTGSQYKIVEHKSRLDQIIYK